MMLLLNYQMEKLKLKLVEKIFYERGKIKIQTWKFRNY
jgi:hypothetical protein